MSILYNVYVNTARRQYNTAQDTTSAAQPYLMSVPGSIAPNLSPMFQNLPESALRAEYTLMVDTGTDIAPGDQITAIYQLDGITRWPGDVQSSGPGAPTILWTINYIMETAPGFLAHRMVYLSRVWISGPVHL